MLIYVETIEDFNFLADREKNEAPIFISAQQRPKEDTEDLKMLCCATREVMLRARVPINTSENLLRHYEGRIHRVANIVASGDTVRIEPYNVAQHCEQYENETV